MTVAEREQAKYEKVWTHAEYRQDAPGEKLVDDAIAKLGMQSGQSVIDFGCGTGRAANALQSRGLKVTAVDHAANCLDKGMQLDFIQASLWSPLELAADYGYCTDVMEHIPSEFVHSVLENIRRCTQAAYFQIATRPDVMGKLVGEKLHLTVQGMDWWRDTLLTHWDDVEVSESNGSFVAVCR